MAVFRVQLQLTLDFPRNVRKLKHRDRYISRFDGLRQFFARADGRDEIGEVKVGHIVCASEIGR